MAEADGLEDRLAGSSGRPSAAASSGAGVLTAAKLIAEVGDVRRFRSADAFAMLAGVAPIPASLGQIQRMRLNRGGNRQLNRALYVIALVQAWHHPRPRHTSRASGPRARPGERPCASLKRHLARVVFHLLVAGRVTTTAA